MTVAAAARYLRLGYDTVWRMARAGAIKGFECIDGHWRISRADLDAYIESSRIQPGTLSPSSRLRRS